MAFTPALASYAEIPIDLTNGPRPIDPFIAGEQGPDRSLNPQTTGASNILGLEAQASPEIPAPATLTPQNHP